MEYSIGVLILMALWLCFFMLRKDLRNEMILSGWYYFFVVSFIFILIKLINPQQTIVPGYWNPDTLFNLGRITGGYAIEDAFYVFLTGGIAASVYEVIF